MEGMGTVGSLLMFYVQVENLFTLSIIKNVVNTRFSINAVNVVKTPSNKLARSMKNCFEV